MKKARSSGVMRLVVILAVIGLVVVACGSSKKAATSSPPSSPPSSATNATSSASNTTTPAGSTAGSSAAPSGSPIKVMTIASVNYSGPNYENILETAKLYQDWINAHGGIKGHPLQVTTCDEQGDPTKTAQCGQRGHRQPRCRGRRLVQLQRQCHRPGAERQPHLLVRDLLRGRIGRIDVIRTSSRSGVTPVSRGWR